MKRVLTINRNTRITALLAEDQEAVIGALVKLNRNFSKLRNPVLRNLFARRINIEDACRIAHCDVDDFLTGMKQIGFCIDEQPEAGTLTAGRETMDFDRHANVRELDVRPYLDRDIDPLKEILKLTSSAKKGECIKIINSFEPVPLISLLSDRGFRHQVKVVEKNEVITWFKKTETEEPVKGVSPDYPVSADKKMFDSVMAQFKPEKIRCIDVRQLEMPQPMLQIIAHLEELSADELLYVHHKKLPVFLIPELSKRGLTFLFYQKSAQELELLIYKP